MRPVRVYTGPIGRERGGNPEPAIGLDIFVMSKLVFTLCWVPGIHYITKKERSRMRKGKGKGERGREKEGGGGCKRGAGRELLRSSTASFFFLTISRKSGNITYSRLQFARSACSRCSIFRGERID